MRHLTTDSLCIRPLFVALATLLLAGAACHPVKPVETVPPDPAEGEGETEANGDTEGSKPKKSDPPKATAGGHESLHATLWTQSAVEYKATTWQAYHAALPQLDGAIKDTGWTASVEQLGTNFKDKPPAIILDVDETVLDNSPYQARLIESGKRYETDTWNKWCNEASAPAIPGAVDLTKYAAAKGVTVFFVTNRDASLEEATRRNLAKHGFPLPTDKDTVLMKNEKSDWGSDKTPRRQFVAENYRIILMFGDNLGDFMGDAKGTPPERFQKARAHSHKWGRQWFMLPNAMYGYWEGAVTGYDNSLSEAEIAKKKRSALKTKGE